jgi:uncharacterized protein (DUF302 family)
MSKMTGVIVKPSPFTVKESAARLSAFLLEKGFTLYAHIDQQDELNKVGLTIQPLEYFLFGNPKTGGQLMVENPLVALDLPLKIVFYEDKANKGWVAYNDAKYIIDRYDLPHPLNPGPDLGDLIIAAFNKP